jgi:signal transduction histidine kinase
VDVDLGGLVRSFRFSVVPLQHPLAAALLHVEELTEAVDAEARLRRSEALAQLGAMSAAVAHELRNPLAGISGAIQVIARTLPVDDRRRPIMEKVEQAIHRLNDLVTDLLGFARPDPAKMTTVVLEELAREVAEVAHQETPGVDVTVGGSGSAHGDPRLIRRVLLHLVQNATQAMDGRGHVLLQIAPGQVLVNDDGPGILPEHRAHIFEPFFTTRTRGTGLGLAVSLQGATAMGGTLTLSAGPLPGAAFLLTLTPTDRA